MMTGCLCDTVRDSVADEQSQREATGARGIGWQRGDETDADLAPNHCTG